MRGYQHLGPTSLNVFEGHLWNFEIVGNKQTQKIVFLKQKNSWKLYSIINNLKYASVCQIDAIFAIKIF